MKISAHAILLYMLMLCPLWALTVDTPLPDAAQEARAKALFHEIRCVVCQSEAIADSPADVAQAMRRLVREKIAAGETDSVIEAYLASRYGDRILMKPPFSPVTWMLWLGPALILLGGIGLIRRYFRGDGARHS